MDQLGRTVRAWGDERTVPGVQRREIGLAVGAAVGLGAAVAGAAVMCAELAHQRAASPLRPTGPVTLVVLGYRSRPDGRAHRLQRWRAEQAVRAAHIHRAARMIITGGPTRGPEHPSEADVMADLIRDQYRRAATREGPASPLDGSGRSSPSAHPPELVLERLARSTRENVEFTRELVGDDFAILVSDPLHAGRARRHWLRAHPGDASRVGVVDTVPRWRNPLIKTRTALTELQRWRW
ncbi:MAG: YdcF family protein [Actinomycetales bacterium]